MHFIIYSVCSVFNDCFNAITVNFQLAKFTLTLTLNYKHNPKPNPNLKLSRE